jgi:hypothetical protein
VQRAVLAWTPSPPSAAKPNTSPPLFNENDAFYPTDIRNAAFISS